MRSAGLACLRGLRGLRGLGALAALVCAGVVGWAGAQQEPATGADPMAWGSDHVEGELPSYATGDECLFCHRIEVGPAWPRNVHQLTMRAVDPESAAYRAVAAVTSGLDSSKVAVGGGGLAVHFLKPSGAYGKFQKLNRGWRADQSSDDPGEGIVLGSGEGEWLDDSHFAEGCAGCHATAVDGSNGALSSPSLDCFTCHGVVDPNHGSDTSLVLFSEARREDPLVVLSVCGSCHLRGGSSRSTGRPYPNQFVPGDNLFLDFEVDLAPESIAELSVGERHIFENASALIAGGRITCATCHSVHGQHSTGHQVLRWEESCATCHPSAEDPSQVVEWTRSSETCEY